MIVDTILEWFRSLICGAIDKFPSISQYNPATSELHGFTGLISHCAYFLPLGTMALCILAIIAVHGAMNSVWVFNWIVKRIRGG